MTRTLDRAVQLSVLIQAERDEIRARKERLSKLEAELKTLLKGDGASESGVTDEASDGASHSVASAAAGVLDANAPTPMDIDQIAAALKDHNVTFELDSLRTTLGRIAREGRIKKVRRGLYQSVRGTAHAGLNGTSGVHVAEGGDAPLPTH